MVSPSLVLQGFSLKMLKHLVLDEADRLLNMDFEQEIDQILKAIPKVCPCHPAAIPAACARFSFCLEGCLLGLVVGIRQVKDPEGGRASPGPPP